MSVDTATSISKYADLSCCCVGKIMKKDGEDICVIWDIAADRLKTSELGVLIVNMVARHSPQNILIERGPDSDGLAREINRNAMLRGVPIPQIYWKSTQAGGTSVKNKMSRIRNLEPALASDRLWFNSTGGTWVDQTFEQFTNFDGIHSSNTHRKDDIVDAIALLQHFMPKKLGDPAGKSDEQEKMEQEAAAAERLKAWQRHMFGTDTLPQPRPVEPEPERNDPISNAMKKVLGFRR